MQKCTLGRKALNCIYSILLLFTAQPLSALNREIPTFASVHLHSAVVGYAQSDLKYGGSLATPQFLYIGADTATPITSIVPIGDDTYNNIAIQTLDAYGYTENNYSWTDAGGEGWDEIGWVDDDNNLVTDVTFEPGQALWVLGSSSSQGLQTSGKVGTSDVEIQLRYGGTLAGNPFPVKITLGDLIPTGEDMRIGDSP